MSTAAPAQSPPPRPAVMGPYRPDWMEKPSADDLSDFYPAHAARHAISGKATIVCKVRPDGLLSDCVVEQESPPGEHFGEAALKLSKKFRMIPPDDPTAAPATVTVPLVFQLPETRVMIRPGEDALLILQGAVAIAAIAGFLLVTMIWVLARYNKRAAVRAAERS